MNSFRGNYSRKYNFLRRIIYDVNLLSTFQFLDQFELLRLNVLDNLEALIGFIPFDTYTLHYPDENGKIGKIFYDSDDDFNFVKSDKVVDFLNIKAGADEDPVIFLGPLRSAAGRTKELIFSNATDEQLTVVIRKEVERWTERV